MENERFGKISLNIRKQETIYWLKCTNVKKMINKFGVVCTCSVFPYKMESDKIYLSVKIDQRKSWHVKVISRDGKVEIRKKFIKHRLLYWHI